MSPRFVAFIVVGASGFLVQTAVLVALTVGAGWPPVLATALAVEAAVLSNFVWHERWTWRDRTGVGNRAGRLGRFHLSSGMTSMAGNIVVTAVGVGVFHVSPLSANAVAVVLLSLTNYVAADRWAFAGRGGALALALALLAMPAAPLSAADLRPDTVAAWNQHVRSVESSLPRHERDAPLVAPQGRIVDVPGGAIHEWRGSTLIENTTVGAVVDALLSSAARPLQEDVAAAQVLERHGDSLRIYMRLVRKTIVTATFDTEHDVAYARRSPSFATSRSVATRIVETGGTDRGFLWRLNSYWRYRQVGRAVQVDVLSLSLSRDVPWLVRPIAAPFIDRIGRESMSRTLATVQVSATTYPKTAVVRADHVPGP